MKVMVTGGAGFIGSHVCDRLIRDGHDVAVIDNLQGGRIENIQHHIKNNKIQFYNKDIRDIETILPLFSNMDSVIHLAGIADIVPSIEHPKEYFETNVQGTMHVLECARRMSLKRFVYAASSSCYGLAKIIPTPETAKIEPCYPYALTKYLGEELVMHWAKVYGIEVTSLRLFNVYGPRVRTNGAYGAVFGVFLAQKAHKCPLTIVGDGSQTRDFTYVTDVADAFCCALESPQSGHILNVGSGNTYSINLLAKKIGGNGAEIIYIPKRPGEPDCTFADITSIKKILGWNPKISFDAGVGEMMREIDKWKDAPLWNRDAIQKATAQWFHYLGGKGHVPERPLEQTCERI